MSQPPIPESFKRAEWIADEISTTDRHGHQRYWQIYVELLDADGKSVPIPKKYYEPPSAELPRGYTARIDVRMGIIDSDGKRTRNATDPTLIREGKNLGRKNATNALTQAISEARSRYRKQLKSSAPRLREESKTATTGAITSLAKEKGRASKDFTEKSTEKSTNPAVAPGPRPVMLARNLEDKWPPLAEFCGDLDPETGERRACVFVLRKFDGVRAGVFLQDKAKRVELVFFGRRLDLQERRADMYPYLQPFFETARRLGWNERFGPMVLDGEIYRHGWSRQTIVGKEHRQDEKQAAAADLDYYVFLVRFPFTETGRALPIRELLRMRHELFDETAPPLDKNNRARIVGAEFLPVLIPNLCDEHGKLIAHTKEERERAQRRVLDVLEEHMNRFTGEGYEGAVIYRGCLPYEESTESHRKGTLLRLKPVFEEEFEVVDFEADKRGKAEGAIKWILLTPALKGRDKKDLPPRAERKTFKTTFKDMTLDDRKRWFREMRETDSSGRTAFERLYRGKPLTVSFRDYTDDGVPMHAWATGFRDIFES